MNVSDEAAGRKGKRVRQLTLDGRMDGCIDVLTNEWMYRQMAGWLTDRQVDGWTGERG